MWESIIKCTAVNSSSFCSSSLFKGRAESVMVLGKSAAGRGTRDFLFPEICSGVEITLSIHTQQTSEARGKKKQGWPHLSWRRIWGWGSLPARSQPDLNENCREPVTSAKPSMPQPCLQPHGNHPVRRRAHLPLSRVEGQDHRAAALWKTP